MRIAVMQDCSAVGDVERNLDAIEAALKRASDLKADVLVTPELFVTGYAPPRQRVVDAEVQVRVERALAAAAARHGLGLVASYPEVAFLDASDAPTQFICATLFSCDGEVAARYRKVHLFGDDEPASFAAGHEPPPVVRLGEFTVALAVCFDVEFPETVRAAALAGADVVLAPTALTVGFDDVPSILLRARALENGVALAYANHAGTEDGLEFSGNSVILGPAGDVLSRAGGEAQIIVADVSRMALDEARTNVSYLLKRRPDAYQAWGLT